MQSKNGLKRKAMTKGEDIFINQLRSICPSFLKLGIFFIDILTGDGYNKNRCS